MLSYSIRNALLTASVVSFCPLALGQSLTDMDNAASSQPTTQITSVPPAQTENGELAPPDVATMSIPTLLHEARAALEAKNGLLAKSMVQAVLDRDEGNVDADLIDAEIAVLEGDNDRARKRYLEVVAVRPDDFDANLGLGRIYLRSKVYRQAKFYLERAEPVAPQDRAAELLTLLAKAYRGAGYVANALDAAEHAVQVDPESIAAWQYLVQLRTQSEDYQKAMQDSDKLVELARRKAIEQPSDRDTIEQLYGAYQTQLSVLRAHHQTLYQPSRDGKTMTDKLLPGLEKQAAEDLRRIVDLMIVQAELVRTIGYFEIRKVAERAVQYDPTNVNVQIQYGLLLRNTSEFTKAREAFEKVLAIDPQNAEAHRQLASLGVTSGPTTPATTSQPEAATPSQ